MALTALLDLRLRPDDLPGARRLLDEILVDTRAFPGCQGLQVMTDVADPAHVIVFEQWESVEADAAYRKWRAGEGASNLGSVLTGPPTLTVLTE